MAIIWYAVQAYIAGLTVSLMLKSIFGEDLDARIPNSFGSPNATTYEFMCFLFSGWVVFHFFLIAPHNLKYLFTVKVALVSFAAFGFLIWAVRKTHGSIDLGALNAISFHGSDFNWVMVRSIIGYFATLIVNAPYFSRFSRTKNSSLWIQLIAIPFLFSITCLIGIIVKAAGFLLYGINYPSPIDVLAQF